MDDKKIDENKENIDTTLRGKEYPMLQIDIDEFQSYLDGSDLSDSERSELLQVILDLVMCFVDIGFGLDPVQQALEKKESGACIPAISVLELEKESKLRAPFDTAINKETMSEGVSR